MYNNRFVNEKMVEEGKERKGKDGVEDGDVGDKD